MFAYVVPTSRHQAGVVFNYGGQWYRVSDVLRKFRGDFQEFISGGLFDALENALVGASKVDKKIQLKNRGTPIDPFDADHFSWRPLLRPSKS
jgi:hypothetical protein